MDATYSVVIRRPDGSGICATNTWRQEGRRVWGCNPQYWKSALPRSQWPSAVAFCKMILKSEVKENRKSRLEIIPVGFLIFISSWQSQRGGISLPTSSWQQTTMMNLNYFAATLS